MFKKLARILMVAGVVWLGLASQPAWADCDNDFICEEGETSDNCALDCPAPTKAGGGKTGGGGTLQESENGSLKGHDSPWWLEYCAFGFDFEYVLDRADSSFTCGRFLNSHATKDHIIIIGEKEVESYWTCDKRPTDNYFDPCPKGGAVTWAGNAYSCNYNSKIIKNEEDRCAEGFDYIDSFEGSDACAPPADFCCYNSSPCGEEGEMVASEANRVCCVKYKKNVIEKAAESREKLKRKIEAR